MNLVRRLINDESGATAIEYGLIAALVAVAIIAALTALGGSLDTLFSNVATTVSQRHRLTAGAAAGSGRSAHAGGLDLATTVLWVLVGLATVWDVAQRRIPNRLVLVGLFSGMALRPGPTASSGWACLRWADWQRCCC